MRYSSKALIRPSKMSFATPSQKILKEGVDGDFLLTTTLTKSAVMNEVLPVFEKYRVEVNFGGPFRKGPKNRGRNAILNSVDILGLALHYLKSTGFMYDCCPIFGMCQKSVSV